MTVPAQSYGSVVNSNASESWIPESPPVTPKSRLNDPETASSMEAMVI